MMRWFNALPLHRKLVIMVLAISTAAVAAAVAGLIALDVVRFRTTAVDDASALAQVIAANSNAAVVFDDPRAARQILDSVQVRPVISRACIYRTNGTLLAGYERDPASRCPATPGDARGWHAVATTVPVSVGGRAVGSVYVERMLTDLPGRMIFAAIAAALMLILAAALAFALAQQAQQLISTPIVALANAARTVGTGRYEIPQIDAPPDETGALVRAFSEMMQRLAAGDAERDQLLTREREASRLKDEFLASVSHELRTPLNAILGWVQILEQTKPTDPTMVKAIATVARNARAQQRVIEDLLDVSRMISGKLQLTLVPIDLRAALEAAIDVVAPIATAKRIEIAVEARAASCLIQGDFDRIRQVLWNLLSNAVKFTPAGGRIDVRLDETDHDYEVRIADTGIGIDAAFLPHVFERFRQADGSTTREYSGLGLGLAIVKELTERHNGTVRAESDGVGRGATFIVELPRLLASAPGIGSSAKPAAIFPLMRLDGISVLAIDDDADSLDLIASTLRNVGADVRTASTSVEALEELRRIRPDVVLCDLAMPVIDGFEMLERIRALDHLQGNPIPVLAVTAYASDEYQERCRRAGFRGHIGKPYDPEELIRGILGAARAVQR